MKNDTSYLGTVGAALAIMLACGLAASAAEPQKAIGAQTPAAPAPVSSDPTTTAATFGDWVLNCQRLSEGSKPARICEVTQSIQVQGQQGVFARIAIGRIAPDKPLSATVVLPNNISLPSVAHIGPQASERGHDLNWTRCTPGGCFAGAVLTDDILKQWRTTTDVNKITFKDAVGRDVNFPISFRGLPQALDALAREM